MTRDEFFQDVTTALRLLTRLGAPAELAAELDQEGRVDEGAGGRGVTPDELRRYADAIDWTRQDDPRLLGELAPVLLRIVAAARQARE